MAKAKVKRVNLSVPLPVLAVYERWAALTGLSVSGALLDAVVQQSSYVQAHVNRIKSTGVPENTPQDASERPTARSRASAGGEGKVSRQMRRKAEREALKGR